MTDWSEINERLELKDRKLEEAILRDMGAQRALRKLVRAGADKSRVMRFLVFSVRDLHPWRKPARRLKRQLESVADQLETLAKHAEKVDERFHSHALVMTMYLHLYSGKWGKQDPDWDRIWERATSTKGSFAKALRGFMYHYAENCRAKATHIGKLLREFPPRQRRKTLDTLMLAVWHDTKCHYDREVAYLLTRAFEVSGKERHFSEEQIKKHRQRHVMARIRQYLERSDDSSRTIGELGS